jgi:steroid delta-isomerase-like uncharacterized protein
MKNKTLTLLTTLSLVYTASSYAQNIPSFDMNSGQLLIPKVKVLSSSGDSIGTFEAELQEMRDDSTRDFMVTKVISVEDEPSNRHIARLFLRDLLTEGDLSLADEILAPNAVIHVLDSFTPDFGTGPEAMKQIAGLYRSTFPDIDITIDEVIATGDKVIARFTINGTQTGDLPGIPATNLKVAIPGVDIYQIQDGQIVEFWHTADTLGLMKSVGAVPETPPTDSTTQAQNENLVTQFLRELLSEGNLDIADEIMASDAIIHLEDSFTPDFGTGPEAMKQIVGLYRNTFPDLDITIDDMVATGDKVFVRFTINGTQMGDLPGIPATGIKVAIPGVDIYQIQDGLIVEFWHTADTLGLMKSVGAVPETPPTDSTTQAQNENLVTQFLRELLSEGNLDIADEIMASDAIIHLEDSFTPDFGTGPEAMKQIVGLYRNTFPDLDITIDDMVATGDKVFVRFTINGTQMGDLPGIPATGLAVSIKGMDQYRIQDGKIAEFWHSADTLGLMKTLGVVPE